MTTFFPRITLIGVFAVGLCACAAEAQQPTDDVYLAFPQLETIPQPQAAPMPMPKPEKASALLPQAQSSDAAPSSDAELIELGEELFMDSCVDCHEAERATDKRKTYAGWLSTIERMSKKEDAQIPMSSFVAIATYLTSLGPPTEEDDDGKEGDEEQQDGEADGDDDDDEASQPRFDPQEVARGQSAFQSSCTVCHDAARALNKKKSLAGWLSTVRRMARMDGADVDAADIRPIAVYLASLSAPAGGAGMDGDDSMAADDGLLSDALGLGSNLNISGTISTLWRGGNDNLENPNFFADAWVRFDWQPEGPLKARVTTCTSCHSDQTGGGGFTLELVEAVASFDLLYGIRQRDRRPEECKGKVEAEARAGRFVVPFGAFHAMSHPGAYRTVTNPLMFNMGRQVNRDGGRPPVLPMPYSDEGVDLYAMIPLRNDWKITLDGYAVNGLQGGGPGVNFTRSRSYADNNHDAGYGARATVGNKQTRFGGSVMAGRLEDEGGTPLNYHLAGADATARLFDNTTRLYFEYAMRRNDSIFGQRQISYGIVSELEVLLLERPNLSALVRYDTLEHRDFFGASSIERFTWGFSTTAAWGTLILNHEHWNFPTDAFKDVDVLGVRWVATF